MTQETPTKADDDPVFSTSFPAHRLSTLLDWDDLVLEHRAKQDLEDIVTWTQHRRTLETTWELNQRLRPGFRSLFHGPPGTGKTLAAALLGKRAGLHVYRVDLSRVVSKFIGETEKNLASLFDRADEKDWILFFDEADALWGKRTQTHSANDRAADQQTAYLLQRIENYPGIAVLASNSIGNIDETFVRRFQSTIRFAVPNNEQRRQLWHDCFTDKPFRLADDVDLDALARDHALTGGAIVNVLGYACLQAVDRSDKTVQASDLDAGVRRELQRTDSAQGDA